MCIYSGWERAVLHVDADAFFASVEEVLRPGIKGKPVIVGGTATGRGVVSSANYIARQYGVRSAMSMKQAMRLCPNAILARSGFGEYRDFSRRMFDICRQYSPVVEVTSIDEGYLDLAGTELMHGDSLRGIAKRILSEINKSLGISVSGGLGSNKTIAKIASGLNKPHCLTTVIPGSEGVFLQDLPIEKMPGIGPKTKQLLNNYNFKKLGDIAELDLEQAYGLLGRHGLSIWKKSRGIDNREVRKCSRDRKSISKERTFSQDQSDIDYLIKKTKDLISQVLFSLRNKGFKAHTLNLKIRYSDFETKTYSKVLPSPMDSDFEIFPILKGLFLSNVSRKKRIRLIGCGVSDLRKEFNMTIFDFENQSNSELIKLGDQLRNKYGKDVIEFGRG